MLTLLSGRLVLRDFHPTDEVDYVALRTGEQFSRLYPADEVGPAASRYLLAMFIGWQVEPERSCWQLAITLRDNGALIGSCGVRVLVPGEMSFGCELGERYWRQGYALEAADCLLRFAAEQLGCQRVVTDTLEANHSALMLAQRLGFIAEASTTPRTRIQWSVLAGHTPVQGLGLITKEHYANLQHHRRPSGLA
ncbi:GNAT family N-acetyltransferase [Chitinimonas sp. BJB300]|uniref:GNAT family N-acetyltransferase n=1 Tax=Chitinimonas sp. BJB300 TaxID=1559339 RepID=UPI0013044640|nr:GNAT family N-acetyltransferase [Chitinimonas sp. BJB300]